MEDKKLYVVVMKMGENGYSPLAVPFFRLEDAQNTQDMLVNNNEQITFENTRIDIYKYEKSTYGVEEVSS